MYIVEGVQMIKFDSLKKIEILLESGTTSNKMDLTSQPVKKTFIFGIDSEGLQLNVMSNSAYPAVRVSSLNAATRFW